METVKAEQGGYRVVLDVRVLSEVSLKQLESTCDSIAKEELNPGTIQNIEPIRINKEMSKFLEIPDFDTVCQLLASEHSLTGKNISIYILFDVGET